MDFLTTLGILARAAPGILTFWRQMKADEAALQYLTTRYSLNAPQRHSYGPTVSASYGGTDSYQSAGADWLDALNGVLNVILGAASTDESTCIASGELAMFIRVVPRYNERHEVVPLFEAVLKLQNTETYKSLVEMGRGRGGEYALRLIQTEVRKVLPPA